MALLKILLLSLGFITALAAVSQEEGLWIDPNPHQPATLIGGLDSLMEVTEGRRLMPSECTLAGSVFVKFLIDKYGGIKESSIMKGLCPATDSTASAISRKLKFKPAITEKKPIESKLIIPFPFYKKK